MQHEERHLVQNDAENAGAHFRGSEVLLPNNSGVKPPFVVRVEEKCEECGGSGTTADPSAYRSGGVPRMSRKRQTDRSQNYLAEALRIAAREKRDDNVQREHSGGDHTALPQPG